MPTINKLPKKEKTYERTQTDMRILRQKAYNSKQWISVRKQYLMENPICEECLKRGVVNAGTVANPLSVHHKVSPFIGGEINWHMLCDLANLETVCNECHGRLHTGNKPKPEDLIKILDELLDDDTDDNN